MAADGPKHEAPQGMEPYDLRSQDDLGALSAEQQDKLNQFKVVFVSFSREYVINSSTRFEVVYPCMGFYGRFVHQNTSERYQWKVN